MKWIPLLILITGIVLVAGCTTSAPTTTTPATTPPTATPSVPLVPDLIGNWSGSSTGYLDQSGYTVFNDTLMMKVTGQDGHLFTGMISFPQLNGTMVAKEFAGVIGDDGRTILTIEYPGGFSDGVLLSSDEIELIFRDEANPSTISIDSLRRLNAATSAPTPAIPVMPAILGNWSGTSIGYKEQNGYQAGHGMITMNVTGQNDRLFKGQVSYEVNGTIVTKDFAGAFGRDGKTIRTVENPDGFSDGIIVSSGEIQLIFRDNNNPSRIAIDTFTRAPASPTPAGDAPARLVGKWLGSSTGYMNTGSGYGSIRGVITMNITGQDDRIFRGQVSYEVNGTAVTKNVVGAFDRDGKTIRTLEYPDGFNDGIVVSASEIRLVFRDSVNTSSIAIDSFRKV